MGLGFGFRAGNAVKFRVAAALAVCLALVVIVGVLASSDGDPPARVSTEAGAAAPTTDAVSTTKPLVSLPTASEPPESTSSSAPATTSSQGPVPDGAAEVIGITYDNRLVILDPSSGTETAVVAEGFMAEALWDAVGARIAVTEATYAATQIEGDRQCEASIQSADGDVVRQVGGVATRIVFSEDGTSIAYVQRVTERSSSGDLCAPNALVIRDLGTGEERVIPTPEGFSYTDSPLFWSGNTLVVGDINYRNRDKLEFLDLSADPVVFGERVYPVSFQDQADNAYVTRAKVPLGFMADGRLALASWTTDGLDQDVFFAFDQTNEVIEAMDPVTGGTTELTAPRRLQGRPHAGPVDRSGQWLFRLIPAESPDGGLDLSLVDVATGEVLQRYPGLRTAVFREMAR